MASTSRGEAALIAELNDLIQLDHDAVEGYTIAIDRVKDAARREQLVQFRADHKRHIEELAALVRARGGLPTEFPHPTGALKLAVQALGAIGNDTSLLLAFKAVEGQVRDKYRRANARTHASDVGDVIGRAAMDEDRHYAWVERSLAELGAGTGTLSHNVASAVEKVHKLIADPIERVEREVMRNVGRHTGTTRSRGGAEAPLPTDMPSAPAAETQGGAQRFIDALRALEEGRDVERIIALFDDEAEISNPNDARPHQGREGARHFWRAYRDSFEEIHSDFSRVVEGDGTAVLEWKSHGRMRNGQPVDYAGVSVLDIRGDKVRRFRAYFDPRDLDEQAEASGTP
jgi:ketosteroid isomerase-like protein/rubrerythrin